MTQRRFHPSPVAWEDQVLYFLMLDRFSAGLYRPGDVITCLYSTDRSQIGTTALVEERNSRAARLTVPAAGFAMFE